MIPWQALLFCLGLCFNRTVPRTNPVPESEKQIGGRLREFRLSTKLSQAAFARVLEIDSSLLAAYEHGRVPVRYSLAKRVADKFGMSLAWLAEGLGNMRRVEEIHPSVNSRIGERVLFSYAYTIELRSAILARRKLRHAGEAGGLKISFPNPIGTPREEEYLFEIRRFITEQVAQMPRALQSQFANELHRFTEEFLSAHAADIPDKKKRKS
jgi:transcriptional regulator with XRE-family HTH domain